MQRGAMVALAIAIVGAVAVGRGAVDQPWPEPQPHPIPFVNLTWDVVAINCPAGYNNGHAADDVCLAYNGQIPGPVVMVERDQSTNVTIRNRIAETLANVTAPQAVKDELAAASISWHRHGVSTPAGEDGTDAPPGTNIIPSVVPPGGEFTYHSFHNFPGAWHYHDHVMWGGGAHGPERGLFGSILVVESGAQPDHVFDLHLLDAGPNAGLGLNANVEAGEAFVLMAVGLGDRWWDVELTDPAGTVIHETTIGPGTSEAMWVGESVAGAYTWRATTPFQPGVTRTGVVVAQ